MCDLEKVVGIDMCDLEKVVRIEVVNRHVWFRESDDNRV